MFRLRVVLQPTFDMSINSPSPGTPVPYYRCGNTSTYSHQSEPQECILMNHTVNDSGK